METVVIALGSNLGDREANLRFAVSELQSISTTAVRCSSFWESEPLGPSEHFFLNAVVALQTELTPEELFEFCKSAERAAGRKPGRVRWAARVLDLDIIYYGNLVIHTESLIIPHREYRNRLFVLLPLQEVCPGCKDPETQATVSDMISACPTMTLYKTAPPGEG